MNRRIEVLCLSITAVVSSNVALAASSVRNGGDTIARFLETTRSALIRTLSLAEVEGETLCSTQVNLDDDQVAECRRFILSTRQQVLVLNRGRTPLPFVVKDRVTVPNDDGSIREVVASTLLGPSGDIDFNFSLIRNLSPREMLQVLAHEFGHKSMYKGDYVDDHNITDAFPSGRQLLDGIGAAIADLALEQGVIGRDFNLLDRFKCQVWIESSGQSYFSSTKSIRYFTDPRSFDVYETGIGNSPRDDSLGVPLTREDADLVVRLRVREPSGCRNEIAEGSETMLQLVKVPNDPSGEAEVVEERNFPWNPICFENSGPEPLSISYGDYRFTCAYVDSFALTD